MNDLIKRDDAIKVIKSCTWGKSQREAIDDMLRVPEAVVRCGHCANTDRPDEHMIWCTGRGSPMLLVPPDGFCEQGRWKDGEAVMAPGTFEKAKEIREFWEEERERQKKEDGNRI